MRYNKRELKLRLDYNNMMSSSIGKEGLSEKDFRNIESEIAKAYTVVEAGKGIGMMSPPGT